MTTKPSRPNPSLRTNTEGSIFSEYVVAVGVCAIAVSAAIASLGIPLLTGYSAARQVLIAPTP